MNIILYNELDPKKVPNFTKVKKAFEADNFSALDIKKVSKNLYRIKLNKTDRLLFTLHHFNEEYYALILEYLPNHSYDKSRFMRMHVAQFDEDKIKPLTDLAQEESEPLTYINKNQGHFHLLDKILSFDQIQHDIFQVNPPLIVIGSAGSGKTALTLEKMKAAVGKILYVTRSPYLAQNAQKLYFSHHYENDVQEIDFLSFDDFLATIKVPSGREMNMREFSHWFERHRSQVRGLKDAHQLFEEFKGVITGPNIDEPYLNKEAYLNLGVKQSIIAQEQREAVYELFLRYLEYMQKTDFYDANILSQQYLALVQPRYDFLLVDEVQDLTNVQLHLILKTLHHPTDFVLCGDSNQIVHPNFFSWSKIKTLFYETTAQQAPAQLIRVLNTNYRNSAQVTELANRILKIKNVRFGSVDKESNYLVECPADSPGQAVLLNDHPDILTDLNHKTRKSTRYAVVVMHPEQKPEARKHFNTPLVFSIQEAKGLEYENIILYNFLSSETKRFRDISQGLQPEDLAFDELTYSRAKDKTDKSLEIYKFYINALYVAITRAVMNLYVLEAEVKHPFINLLGLREVASLELADQQSSLEEWQQEARKLELQGKQEQADEIRQSVLQYKPVPWEVLRLDAAKQVAAQALEEGNKKAKLALFEYALVYNDQYYLWALMNKDFKPALNPSNAHKQLHQKYFFPYEAKNLTSILKQVEKYGVDFRNQFNQTPLITAAYVGNPQLIEALIKRGANLELCDNFGRTAFQVALGRALADEKYRHKKLADIFELLLPDSITIQVNGQLIKLGNHLMEFFLFNLFFGAFYVHLTGSVLLDAKAFSSAWLEKALATFPDSLLPERRKRRSYISGILSKNEYFRDDKYNRKLFWRIRRGEYLPNPRLSIRIENEWYPVYSLLDLNRIALSHQEYNDFDRGQEYAFSKNLNLIKDWVERMVEGDDIKN